MSDYVQPNRRFDWRIEYEIPPLRAIYHAQAELMTKDEIEAEIAKQNPPWTIRKLTPVEPD